MLAGKAVEAFLLFGIGACSGRQVLAPDEGDGGHAGPADAGSSTDAAIPSCPPARDPVRAASTPTDGFHDTGARFLTLDERHVYFTETGHGFVKRVPLCGGEVEVIAANRQGPQQIADDAAHVYWTELGPDVYGAGTLVQWPKAGGAPVEVVRDLATPWAVVLDDIAVYYGTGNGTWRWDKSSATPIRLSFDTGFANLALDEDHVYWPAQRVAKAGGTTETLAAADPSHWCAAVDDKFLFWTEYFERVWRVEKSGGTPQPLLPQEAWRCLTLDDRDVYAASDAAIWRVRKDGSASEPFANIGGAGIALNDRDVYWATDGGVFRKSK